jgi:hypothetical protein
LAAYRAELWSDFCVAVAGASGALSGLLFVAVSINIERILTYPALPARAGHTLILFATPLLVAIVALVPGQPRLTLGAELMAMGLVATAILAAINRPSKRSDQEMLLYWTFSRALSSALAAIPLGIGGVTLITGAGGGLYWIALAIVAAFIGGRANAWVLLVEILRLPAGRVNQCVGAVRRLCLPFHVHAELFGHAL